MKNQIFLNFKDVLEFNVETPTNLPLYGKYFRFCLMEGEEIRDVIRFAPLNVSFKEIEKKFLKEVSERLKIPMIEKIEDTEFLFSRDFGKYSLTKSRRRMKLIIILDDFYYTYKGGRRVTADILEKKLKIKTNINNFNNLLYGRWIKKGSHDCRRFNNNRTCYVCRMPLQQNNYSGSRSKINIYE